MGKMYKCVKIGQLVNYSKRLRKFLMISFLPPFILPHCKLKHFHNCILN